MINIAICDDNSIMLDSIEKLLKKIISTTCDFRIYKYTNGLAALKDIEQGLKIDIAFLDISMPEIDGFSLADSFKTENSGTLIIFLTSHSEKVFDGYKYGAFRFIPKDSIEENLQEAVLSAIALTRGQNFKLDFKIKDRDSIITLPVCINDIIYFEYLLRTITMHTVSYSYRLYSKTLLEFIKLLEPYDFMVVHRAYLVNPEHIKCFRNTDIVLSNGDLIPIGSKKQQLEEIKKKYFLYLEKR